MVSTGVSPDQLRPVSIGELVARQRPVIIGAGSVSACSGDPTAMDEIRQAVDNASRAMAYVETEKAQAELGKGEAAMACLADPLDPAVAARLYYLKGLLAYRAGDKAATWAEYFRVLFMDPDLPWDDDYSPDSQAIFDLSADEVRK